MKDFSQNAKFKIKGRWWIPESNYKVAGDLCSKNGRMTLSLYGGLNNVIANTPFDFEPAKDKFPVIHGESLDNTPITLLDSFYTYRSPGVRTLGIRPGTSVELASSRLHCNLAAIGEHMSSSEQHFSKCRVEIPSLVTWLADSLFSVDIDDKFRNVKVDYSRPDQREYVLTAHGCTIRITHSVRPPGFPTTAPQIRHKSYVEIESHDPKPIQWFVTRSAEIVDLFSLLYGGTLQSHRLILFDKIGSHGGVSLQMPRKRTKDVAYRHFDFVVASKEVLPSFQDLLEKWLSATSLTVQARRILLSSERHPPGFIELRFLPLVHSAEIIAKEQCSEIISKSDYSAIRKCLLAAIPPDQPKELHESVQNALAFGNGRSLKRSIKKTLEPLSDELCKLFCTDRDKFIAGVVGTRNYFTHYSPTKKLLQGVELHWAIHKLSLMIRILLLLKSGISQDVLEACVRQHIKLRGQRDVWLELCEDGSPFDGFSVE